MSGKRGPEARVEEFSRGYKAGRYEEVYDLYSEDSEIRKGYSRHAYASNMRNAARRTKMEIREAKLAGSELEGDTARVTLLSRTASIVGEWYVEEEFALKREGGEWRIVTVSKVRQWPVGGGGTSVRGMM